MMHLELPVNKLQSFQAAMVYDNYNLILDKILLRRNFIGDAVSCRYCGKTTGETTFLIYAHTFPELIGNKTLFSRDECDECNRYFDKNLENHLSNFLGIARIGTGVKGKKGIPKYKNQAGERIERFGNDLLIFQSSDSSLYNLNNENKTITISAMKSPFNPTSVLRCLTKMGLAILPNNFNKKKEYSESLAWVRENIRPAYYNRNFLKIFITFIPGGNVFPVIRAMVYRRKMHSDYLPYDFCCLHFRNFIIQFPILFSTENNLLNPQTYKMPYVPFPAALPQQLGFPVPYEVDLSEDKILKNIKDEITFSFFGGEEYTVTSPNNLPDHIITRIRELGLKFACEKETGSTD